MSAIFKRELKSYFATPIGYILVGVFYCVTAIYFNGANLQSGTSSLSGLFQFIVMWMIMFYTPILTMKLFSEERKLKTDQLLMTSPVGLPSIVMGKFLSAFVMFLISMSCTVLYTIVTFAFGTPAVKLLVGNIVATIIMAMVFIAIGMFISSLTENQVIAAFATFGIGIFLMLVDSLAASITNPVLSVILNWISIYSRYNSFLTGVFDLSAIVYYLSIVTIFLFLTGRVLEKRRWS